MDSIIITPSTEQEYSFVMEMLRRMKIKARPMQNKSFERIPGLPCTREELVEDLHEAEEDFSLGVPGIPHGEVMEQIKSRGASWK